MRERRELPFQHSLIPYTHSTFTLAVKMKGTYTYRNMHVLYVYISILSLSVPFKLILTKLLKCMPYLSLNGAGPITHTLRI